MPPGIAAPMDNRGAEPQFVKDLVDLVASGSILYDSILNHDDAFETDVARLSDSRRRSQ
jgi:hypothetical protein